MTIVIIKTKIKLINMYNVCKMFLKKSKKKKKTQSSSWLLYKKKQFNVFRKNRLKKQIKITMNAKHKQNNQSKKSPMNFYKILKSYDAQNILYFFD